MAWVRNDSIERDAARIASGAVGAGPVRPRAEVSRIDSAMKTLRLAAARAGRATCALDASRYDIKTRPLGRGG